MPNTPQEDQSVREAFMVVLTKYSLWIPTLKQDPLVQAIFSNASVDVWVKFMDQKPFNTNLSMTSRAKTICTVTAFTSNKLGVPNQREIYINRSGANRTTIVHELFHYFTHPNFDRGIPPPLNEAVTEYFTRKALGKSKNYQQQGFTVDNRAGRYDAHHGLLGAGRAGAAKMPDKPADYMKKAYFQGDTAAITFILTHFKEVADILNAESS